MTVDDVKRESMLFTLENVKTYPMPPTMLEDFYTMWQRFGPQAARDFMIQPLWTGKIPLPSVTL